jgi:nucleotide-binding universal stress UspA family protein
MKNILLPTDFSKNSKNAVAFALEFFKGNSCNFYFLNVQKSGEFILDDVMSGSPGSSVYQVILQDNKKRLKEFMVPFQEKYTREDYEFLPYVDFDALTDSIQQLMDSEKIDLIVMGTNGATGAKEVLFGSNTLQVIRNIDCPLLAIPEKATFEKLESVLFTAKSCKEISHEKAQPLKKILELFHPQLHLLKIKEARPVSKHNCGSCLAESLQGTQFKSHTLSGIPTPIAIDAFTQLFPVELHATFIERETFLERFLYGTNTAKISYGTSVPLLILHKG